MKVMRKKTMILKIMEEIEQVKRDNWAVDCVVITEEEYEIVRREMDDGGMLRRNYQNGLANNFSIPSRHFELVDKSRASYAAAKSIDWQATSSFKFNGHDLYVVPEAYCPK
jgi:hypothetical protein